MKIAFLNIYNGIVERGSEVFVREIGKRMSASEAVDVFQTGAPQEGDSYHIIQIKGIPYIKNQNFLYDFFLFLFSIKCFFHLLKNKYDWIIPVNGGTQVALCRMVRFFSRSKILISGHAGVGIHDRINIVLGKPDVFIALSRSALSWVRENFPWQRAVHIPNGVDLNQFVASVRPAEVQLPPPVVLCVSALLPYKRIGLLIDAVSQIPDVSLLLIGDGPLYEELHNQASSKLSGRFRMVKKVKHEDISGYYKAAKIFSLPSRESEAFGLVYLEALASNVPVVSPLYENRKDIVGEGGMCVHVENIDDYSNAIKKALTTDWGNRPRTQAKKFGWDSVAFQYKKIMGQVL